MADRVERCGLQVAAELVRFIEGEAIPGTGIAAGDFWDGFAGLVGDFTGRKIRNFWQFAREDADARLTPGIWTARASPMDARRLQAPSWPRSAI